MGALLCLWEDNDNSLAILPPPSLEDNDITPYLPFTQITNNSKWEKARLRELTSSTKRQSGREVTQPFSQCFIKIMHAIIYDYIDKISDISVLSSSTTTLPHN